MGRTVSGFCLRLRIRFYRKFYLGPKKRVFHVFCVLFDESSDEEDATCAICLEPLGDAPRMPGCAHRFHAACVLGPDSLASHAWADGVMPSTRRGQRVLCPLCRAPSLIPPGFL